MRYSILLAFFMFGVMIAGCSRGTGAGGDPSVTFVVLNARVWTGNSASPWAEAIAIGGDRIVALGSTADIRELAEEGTRTVDAGGAMVVPGFIDSHVHFLDAGLRLSSVQLRDARTPGEFIRRVKEFAATVPAGTWITGGDWDHTLWGGELPRADWIDSVTPEHPVWVHRLDGHMALANSAAMRAAGVTRATPDVEGGSIERDAEGNPAGVFKDNAEDIIAVAVPPLSPEREDRALDAAMKFVASNGVTAVHHMGTWDDLAVFERARETDRLTTRIYAMVPLASWERLRDTVNARGRGDEWLQIGGLKGFVDGSLGSHTAAMLHPFTDTPDNSGLFINSPEDLYTWVSNADLAGLHVIVHAIGDRAIRQQLDLFERVANENGPRDRRFRMEHAQHIAPADMERFGALDVTASMQPYHAIDDGRWADRVIGPERSRTTYAFRSLLDANARIAFGSDWFVAPPSALEGIYAATTRRTIDDLNPDGWVPSQKITAEEALRAYTVDAAYASFADTDRGTLEPGKLADLVMIDRDITTIPEVEIRDARVLMTMVGGKVVYEHESGGALP